MQYSNKTKGSVHSSFSKVYIKHFKLLKELMKQTKFFFRSTEGILVIIRISLSSISEVIFNSENLFSGSKIEEIRFF